MKSNFHLVTEFHRKYGYTAVPLAEVFPVREKIVDEEVREMKEAAREVLDATTPQALRTAKAHLTKEIIDIIYTLYGTLEILGVDADAAFAEVHRSNMSKESSGPATKAVKGPNFQPAQMEQFI